MNDAPIYGSYVEAWAASKASASATQTQGPRGTVPMRRPARHVPTCPAEWAEEPLVSVHLSSKNVRQVVVEERSDCGMPVSCCITSRSYVAAIMQLPIASQSYKPETAVICSILASLSVVQPKKPISVLHRPKNIKSSRKNEENLDLQYSLDRDAFERQACGYRRLAQEKWHHNKVGRVQCHKGMPFLHSLQFLRSGINLSS